MKICRRIPAILLAAAVMITLTACSVPEEAVETVQTVPSATIKTGFEATVDAPQTISETTQTPTPEPTPSPTPEPTPVPAFAETAGLVFTKKPAELQLLPNFDAVYEDTVMNRLTGVLSVPRISKSEPDTDGMVTYTVEFTSEVDLDYTYSQDPRKNDTNACTVNVNDYIPFDYYTGERFRFDRLHTEGNETASTNLSEGEITLPESVVRFSGSYSLDAKWEKTKMEDQNGKRTVAWHMTAKALFSIRLPADYDGLMFGSEYKKQALSPSVTLSAEYTVPTSFEGNPADWIFFLVADTAD